MPFKQPGPWLFVIAMTALGLAALSSAWLGDDPAAPGTWMILPVCLLLSGPGLLFNRTIAAAAGALALYWLAWLFVHDIPALVAEPGGFPGWVSAAQSLTFATVAAAYLKPELWRVARVVLGLTVVLFGGVHALYPAVVAGLLPDWFPAAGVWPYLTGAAQIALGLMILAGFRTQLAAFFLGLMWLSWIPLVHLPRLIASPGSPFEWTFMLTALALAGAAWSVGERITAKPGEDLQPSAH